MESVPPSLEEVAHALAARRWYYVKYARRLTGCLDQAEDAVATAISNILAKPECERTDIYDGYVCTCVRNAVAMDRRRRESRNVRYGLDSSGVEVTSGVADRGAVDPIDALVPEEMRDAVCALPAIFRSAFVMRELLDMEYDAMGLCSGVARQTAKNRTIKARKILRQSLA